MILKFAGFLIVFCACATAGLLKAGSLQKRVHELEAFLSVLALIANEIRYYAAPTAEILEKLDSSPEFHGLRLFGDCLTRLRETRDISTAWTAALKAAAPGLALDEGDLEALAWFGAVLGSTDAQGQLANCERYTALLAQRLESARQDQARRGRMYTSLGMLTGVFFCVLFL